MEIKSEEGKNTRFNALIDLEHRTHTSNKSEKIGKKREKCEQHFVNKKA